MKNIIALFRKADDPLSASAVPGHKTRAVNNLPMFIAGLVLAIFLGIIGYVMSNKADQANAPVKQEANSKPGVGSTQLAKNFTEEYGNIGQIEPSKPEMPTLPAPVSIPEPSKKDSLPNLPAVLPEKPVLVDEWFELKERLRNARIQGLEAALKANTKVQAELGRTTSQTNLQGQLDNNRQQLANLGNPNAAYQARMASANGLAPSGGQDNSFEQFARPQNSWTLPNSLETPATYTLQAGFIIPAIMISGITSNLPGQVLGQVSQDVFDTPTGKFLLIPKGTRLLGTYNSDIVYGQERVLMAWQRLLFPDGKTLDIQAMPGADSAGDAGFTDEVNNHYIRTFASAILLSGVIAAVSMSQDKDGNQSQNNSNRQRASDSLSEALGQSLGSSMTEMIRKNLNIAPTLHIRPGYRFNVMVTKDMVFEQAYKSRV